MQVETRAVRGIFEDVSCCGRMKASSVQILSAFWGCWVRWVRWAECCRSFSSFLCANKLRPLVGWCTDHLPPITVDNNKRHLMAWRAHNSPTQPCRRPRPSRAPCVADPPAACDASRGCTAQYSTILCSLQCVHHRLPWPTSLHTRSTAGATCFTASLLCTTATRRCYTIAH